MNGKIVLEQPATRGGQSIRIDIAHLAEGLYVVQCLAGNKPVATTKVVKKGT
jgi:hypothetical protein